MYYYAMLFLTVAAFLLCFFLLRSKAGYYWQAIRENEEAAQALGINTFRWKMAAVALSAAMTSVSGVFFAFYYNNLFPEQIFHISRSIEIILGPMIGGVGTLFGPILGAAVLTLALRRHHRPARGARLGDSGHQAGVLRHRAARRGHVPSPRHLAGGFSPFGFPQMTLLEVKGVSKSFRGLQAVREASFEVPQGSINGLIGPNGAGKTTIFNMVAGVFAPDSGQILFNGKPIQGFRPDQVCAAGIGRTFQLVKPFAGLSVLDNVIVGALHKERTVAAARVHASSILKKLNLDAKAHLPASSLTLPDRKRLEVARALATRPRLLLLDEVMAGLRPTECDQMVQVFRDLNRTRG